MIRAFLAALAGVFVFASQAVADVWVCNGTSRSQTFAMAGPVWGTNYRAMKSFGWFNLTPGQCHRVFIGNYRGERVYYYAYSGQIGNDWREGRDHFPVCVPANVSRFERVGSAPFLQSCPVGWIHKPFYSFTPTAPDFKYTIVQAR